MYLKFVIDNDFTLYQCIIEVGNTNLALYDNFVPIDAKSIYIDNHYKTDLCHEIEPSNLWQSSLFVQSYINLNSLPIWVYYILDDYVVGDKKYVPLLDMQEASKYLDFYIKTPSGLFPLSPPEKWYKDF